jgi:hypothetical protein
LRKPRTFTSASKEGSATERRTSICAAKWKMASNFCSVIRAAAACVRMSSSWKVAPAGTFSSLPPERSSTTWTE